MEYGLLGLAIIGAISALKMTGKVSGWVTIAIAVVIGALAGYGGVEGLTIITGILTGLAAVGAVTVADEISQS
jgi:Mg2+/citrate symporter